MPASSFSGLNSWGVYLFASLALVLLFTPQLTGIVKDTRVSADWRNLDGVRAAIDSLRPGVALHFSFGVAGVSDSVQLRGQQVSCFDGNGTISMPVVWALPNVTLVPALHYRFSLAQGWVRVVQDV
jgi:hypothetical protein